MASYGTKKQEMFPVRMGKEELDAFKKYCKEVGISGADAVRNCIKEMISKHEASKKQK